MHWIRLGIVAFVIIKFGVWGIMLLIVMYLVVAHWQRKKALLEANKLADAGVPPVRKPIKRSTQATVRRVTQSRKRK